MALVFACTTQPDESRVGEQPSTTEEAVCQRGQGFVAEGAVPVDRAPGADAQRIVALRWEAHDGCERFVIDLGTAGTEPAMSVGEVHAEVIRSLAVVRLRLPNVGEVAPSATDTPLAGAFARAAYVIRSPQDRSLFVDLHLGGEAVVKVSTLPEPARVVIDLRPGGGTLPSPAVAGPRVVLLEPRPGAHSYPLRLMGYARLFEANVVARLVQDGVEVARTFTTASDWTEAWGAYQLGFDSGPSGRVVLHVGDYSARDGEWEGIMVELTMR